MILPPPSVTSNIPIIIPTRPTRAHPKHAADMINSALSSLARASHGQGVPKKRFKPDLFDERYKHSPFKYLTTEQVNELADAKLDAFLEEVRSASVKGHRENTSRSRISQVELCMNGFTTALSVYKEELHNRERESSEMKTTRASRAQASLNRSNLVLGTHVNVLCATTQAVEWKTGTVQMVNWMRIQNDIWSIGIVFSDGPPLRLYSAPNKGLKGHEWIQLPSVNTNLEYAYSPNSVFQVYVKSAVPSPRAT